jgi:hypothetical protein
MSKTALLGSYVKLSSAVVAILVGVLKCQTQVWKRITQESFQQSLVDIGSVVSEEKIFFKFHSSSDVQNCFIFSQKVPKFEL